MAKPKMGRAERIHAAQQRLSKKERQPMSGETVSMAELKERADLELVKTESGRIPAETNGKGNAKSIRSLIMGMLLENRPTPEIAAALREQFPQSAAAAKSAKHISFYRSLMRKEAKRAAQ